MFNRLFWDIFEAMPFEIDYICGTRDGDAILHWTVKDGAVPPPNTGYVDAAME